MFDDNHRPSTPTVCTFDNLYLTKTTMIADSSGYENNGIIYKYDSLGSITAVSDTPRFKAATHIASENYTTSTASGTCYIYGNCALTNPDRMTVAFWCKPIAGYNGTTAQGQFCTTNIAYGNVNVGSDYQASAMNHRDNAVNINDSASTTQCNPNITFTANEWHHYAITYDGQTGRVYKDGVQTASAAFTATKTLDSFIGVIIGFSKAGNVWRSNDSYYSDFRVYCTCLSAEDILDLYHTPASIDNLGNAHAFEFIQDDDIKIEKNGIFKNRWSEGLELKTLEDGSI